MIELPFVFVAGILGTAHCLGMCGPFVLTIGGSSPGWWTALGRQLSYSAGRIFTYSILGAAAGFCGERLSTLFPLLVNIPAMLAVAAGTLLVYQGLRGAGILPRSLWRSSTAPPTTACLAGGFLAQFLRQPGPTGVFLAGVFTGFLPCGLLFGMLSLATSTHSALLGAATMATFGLGTTPVMVLTGIGGRLMNLATRRWLYAGAAWCLIVTGIISVARGVSFLGTTRNPAASCPLCRE